MMNYIYRWLEWGYKRMVFDCQDIEGVASKIWVAKGT